MRPERTKHFRHPMVRALPPPGAGSERHRVRPNSNNCLLAAHRAQQETGVTDTRTSPPPAQAAFPTHGTGARFRQGRWRYRYIKAAIWSRKMEEPARKVLVPSDSVQPLLMPFLASQEICL